MRKLILSAVGAAALATASMASATIIVTGSNGVTTPCPGTGCSTVNTATQSTIDWSINPAGTNFSGWVEFSNDIAGLYQVVVSTSTPGGVITNAALTGLGGGAPNLSTIVGNTTNSLTLGPISPVPAGNYRIAFGGTTPAGGVATGNLTFQLVPVPEPATWAMMLVGFAGIGMAMRRRRTPALAQVA